MRYNTGQIKELINVRTVSKRYYGDIFSIFFLWYVHKSTDSILTILFFGLFVEHKLSRQTSAYYSGHDSKQMFVECIPINIRTSEHNPLGLICLFRLTEALKVSNLFVTPSSTVNRNSTVNVLGLSVPQFFLNENFLSKKILHFCCA